MGGSALSSLPERELNACAKEGKEWTAGARSVVGGGMVRASRGDRLLFVAKSEGDGAGLDDMVVDVAASVPVAVDDDERKEVRTVMVRRELRTGIAWLARGVGLQGLGPFFL